MEGAQRSRRAPEAGDKGLKRNAIRFADALVIGLAAVFIVVMTVIGVLGVELAARLQKVLIVAQTIALVIFAVVALAQVFGGEVPGSLRPEASWFSPFAVESTGALASGLLIGIFFYWGWQGTVNLNEETEDSATAPGLAAVLSTVILLLTYLSVAVAIVAFAGVGNVAEFADDDAVLGTVATGVLGSPLDKLVDLAVMTSALGATQLAILGAARTSLSMAHAGAMPSSLGKVHPRFLTPYVSTIVVGVLAVIWYAPLNLIAENFLSDTLSGLSLMVTFHFALAGFACVIYYRRELLKSVKNFVFIGAAPLIGGAALTYIFVESLIALADPGQSRIGGSLFGLGLPLVVGLGFLILGAILMVFWRLLGGHERFFARRGLEAVDPEVAAGRAATPTNTGTTRLGA